jgi:hypothetical protein
MVPACVLPVAAQSAFSPGIGTPVPLLATPVPLADSVTRIPTLKVPGKTSSDQGRAMGLCCWQRNSRFSLDLNRQNHWQIATNDLLPAAKLASILAAAKMRLRVQPPETCYSMRNYRFERDDPGSDSTKFKDYSICQPAKQFQAKSAGVYRIVPAR